MSEPKPEAPRTWWIAGSLAEGETSEPFKGAILAIEKEAYDALKAKLAEAERVIVAMKQNIYCENVDTQNEVYEMAREYLGKSSTYKQTSETEKSTYKLTTETYRAGGNFSEKANNNSVYTLNSDGVTAGAVEKGVPENGSYAPGVGFFDEQYGNDNEK